MYRYRRDYPRPQFVREQWENLNGEWDFSFDDGNRGLQEQWEKKFPTEKKILVPFSYETKKSGIHDQTQHTVVWYSRTVSLETVGQSESLLLHFEGSDYYTSVYVNGTFAGSHEGGYNRFTFDITDVVRPGTNRITVRVEDSDRIDIPRGKQRWEKENFGCWYIQTTGIWKTVWLEKVPACRIESIKITPSPKDFSVFLSLEISGRKKEAENLSLSATVLFDGKIVNSCIQPVPSSLMPEIRLNIWDTAVSEWGLKFWTPETPDLYDLELRLFADGEEMDFITSYFGFRDISIAGRNVLLNRRPYYQRLILDQAYWNDSHLTAESDEDFITDIKKIKDAGYNGVRLHQKIEDERFYYLCDKYGLLVWCEAPSAYKFSDNLISAFTTQWMETVHQFYNHPSIVTWTVLNESWGVPRIKFNRSEQHFSEMLYHLTKAIDPMRPVIVNDGWEHTVSDILTLHDYEEDGSGMYDKYMKNIQEILAGKYFHNDFKTALADGYSYREQPILISEYGGIAFDGSSDGWGYGKKVATKEDYLARFDAVTTAIKRLPFVCGYCYTQVTDVQQEINGIMDINRNFKVSPDKLKEINLRPVTDK
jgi:beta-galactosidase/beta-glucuronidase